MPNNADLHTFHHPVYNYSTSDLLSDTHHESENEEPSLETGVFHGSGNSPFDAHYLDQDPHLPNALAGSIDWETITPSTSGVTRPSSQEALGDAGVFGSVPAAYSTYSSAYFNQDLLPIADEFVSQTMARPALSYPIGQMTNPEEGDSPIHLPWGMECQSVSDMIYMNRSPSRPSSALLDHDGLTPWPGPDHTPLTSDRSGCSSPVLLSNHPEGTSCRSVGGTPEYEEVPVESQPADGAPVVIPKFRPASVSSLPLPAPPIGWFKVPQKRYTQRNGVRPFAQLGEITFSTNKVPGFSMANALGRVFTGLDGRDDPVLENANGPVSCRLLFPGYPTNPRFTQIAVQNWKKKRAPITRAKLTQEIAKRVKLCLDEFGAQPIDPSVDARWKIGNGCMKLEKMYLVSIAWVSKGSIQPEIWVDSS